MLLLKTSESPESYEVSEKGAVGAYLSIALDAPRAKAGTRKSIFDRIICSAQLSTKNFNLSPH